MSRVAIAAALALEHVCAGERLVAFSLASYANREHLAWPGPPAASARAGLGPTRYAEAHAALVHRGLVEVRDPGGGRGRSQTVYVRFAVDGPRHSRPINPELFETVLAFSRTAGAARQLLAAMAALADDSGRFEGVTIEELCAAAGFAESTYRRAKKVLIESGEAELLGGRGGRGHLNRWQIADLRQLHETPRSGRDRRPTPPSGARPLMQTVAPPEADRAMGSEQPGGEPVVSSRTAATLGAGGKGDDDQQDSTLKGAHIRRVYAEKGAQSRGVFAVKGAQSRGVSVAERAPERAPQRAPESPPPYARAGSEPLNLGTGEDPPNPPVPGGRASRSIVVEQEYLTPRGRIRRGKLPVDVDEVLSALSAPATDDRDAWQRVRQQLIDAVGESQFEIWLGGTELIAVDASRTLVIDVHPDTRRWVHERFLEVIERCAAETGRVIRFASAVESAVFDAGGIDLEPQAPLDDTSPSAELAVEPTVQDLSARRPFATSCQSLNNSERKVS